MRVCVREENYVPLLLRRVQEVEAEVAKRKIDCYDEPVFNDVIKRE